MARLIRVLRCVVVVVGLGLILRDGSGWLKKRSKQSPSASFSSCDLGERQEQRVAQDASVGKADLRHRAHRIDAFGRRNLHAGTPRRTKETMQVLAHRRSTEDVLTAPPWQ